MATWKSGKEVTAEDLDKALKALGEACFKCGKERHVADCSIAKAVAEVRALKAPKQV